MKRDESQIRKDYRLIVNNLSSTVKWREITDFMSNEGNLELADHGRRRDCDKSCFVDFSTRRGMEEAVKNLDGLEFAGKTVRVYMDEDADRVKPRNARDGGTTGGARKRPLMR